MTRVCVIFKGSGVNTFPSVKVMKIAQEDRNSTRADMLTLTRQAGSTRRKNVVNIDTKIVENCQR